MSDQVQMSFRIPKDLKKQMDALIEKGAFLNEADFLRTAVRDLVQKKAEAIASA